jgi:hypothetical protein
MRENPPDALFGLGDERLVGNHKQPIAENVLPLLEQFVLDPEMRCHVLEIMAPRVGALEEGPEARPRAIERIARQPDQRRLRQEGRGETEEARGRQRLVDDPPRLGEALRHPVAEQPCRFRGAPRVDIAP